MSTFEHRGTRRVLRIFNEVPERVVKFTRSEPAQLIFPDGSSCTSSCIGCADEPCRILTTDERTIDSVNAFAGDSSSAVCPMKAITWNPRLEAPKIDPTVCIGCGICVSRCPVGAISVRDNVAMVSATEPTNADSRLSTVSFSSGQVQQRKQVAIIPRYELQEPILDDVEVFRVTTALSKTSDVIQNTAVRSVLVAAGCSVSLSRKGDVHTRMDGTYSTLDGVRGSLEVEFGLDSLEAVRASLDDVAVLNSRYHLPKSEQTPLVVCGELPRERQGYWQVVRDIYRVLDIKVRTATVGSLLLLVWNGKSLTTAILDELTPHFESTSIREHIEAALGRPVTVPQGLGGILEPEK
ncbi:MAG: 4Fe-4S binding protein [Varibaculum cambriense]|nr:4Fe-4S binding protein [Varibaculum cambriense]